MGSGPVAALPRRPLGTGASGSASILRRCAGFSQWWWSRTPGLHQRKDGTRPRIVTKHESKWDQTLIMWIKLNSNKRHNIDYFWNTVTSPVRTEKFKQMSRPTWLPPTQKKRRHYLTDFIYALISFCLQSAATVQCAFFCVFGTHTRAWRRCADCSRSVGTGRLSWRIHLQVHCWEKTFRMLHQTFNQSWLTDSHTVTHLLFSTTKWTANIVM